MTDVAFHPEARAEYRSAWNWYRARSPQAATRFEDELERVIDLVKSNPTLFPIYERDVRHVGLRRFPYSLVYQVQADRIYIVALAHSARSEGYWRNRV